MSFKKYPMKCVSAFYLFFSINLMRATDVCLCFNEEFLTLLKKQQECYLLECSKSRIDEMLEQAKREDQYEKYMTEIVCNCVIPENLDYGTHKNLGGKRFLGRRAYFYLIAQESGIAFNSDVCPAIIEALEKYLKETFLEYTNHIFFYELYPGWLHTTKTEYEENKAFMEYFNGYKHKPLKKLGNIFKKVEKCVTQ